MKTVLIFIHVITSYCYNSYLERISGFFSYAAMFKLSSFYTDDE